MRTFIAIELPQEIKDSLSRIQQELKKSGADVKWVEPNNIHLTLKFLGEIDDLKLDKVYEIMQGCTKDKDCFEAAISSIGAFPRIGSPRVIWVGIDRGDKETKQIANDLEEKIEKIGIPSEDRAFSSHITIGRTRSALNRKNLVQRLQEVKDKFESRTVGLKFNITKIHLFKSTLTPKGPIYQALKEANLKTT